MKESDDTAVTDFVRDFFDDMDRKRRVDTLRRAAAADYIQREAGKANEEKPQ